MASVAVISGGATGIGLAVAQRLKASGGRVSLWDRDASALEQAAATLGQGADVRKVDVADADGVAAAAQATASALGRIDALVCSAGITGPNTTTWDYPVDAWRQVIDINLNGVFHCNRAVVPLMLARNYGRIVNIASVAGKEGNPNASAYSASKAAVIGLTKSLGKELAKIRRARQLRDACGGQNGDLRSDDAAAHRFHAVEDSAGALRDRRRNRGAGRLALHRRLFVLHRRGVRSVGRAGDLLTRRRMVAPGLRESRLRRYGRTASMILPMWALDSISRCAAAASASGKTRWMTGFSLRAANSGQTFWRNELASATFLAAGLARKVEPVTVSRFIMMCRQSTVTLLPCRNAMIAIRPSSARHFRFFSI